MKTLGDRLKELKKITGINSTELAKKMNVSVTLVSYWENNKREPSQTALVMLSSIFDVTIDYLLKGTEPSVPQRSYIDPTYSDINYYPFVPYAVSAGELTTIEGITELERVAVPDQFLGKYAGRSNIILMPVNGESMNNVIAHGAIIAVETKIPVQSLSQGDIVVINNHGDYTVKRYYNDPKGQRFIFRPDSNDPTFSDIVVSYELAEEIELIGRVVMYNVILK